MAHFAKLDANNVVEQVIVIDNNDIIDATTGKEAENVGIAFCQKLLGATTTWKQTSYNGNFRGNYAGVGMTYAENIRTLGVASTEVFIGVCTNPSWSVGINTAEWYAPDDAGPVPTLTSSQRDAGRRYEWNETNYNADPSTAWVLTTP